MLHCTISLLVKRYELPRLWRSLLTWLCGLLLAETPVIVASPPQVSVKPPPCPSLAFARARATVPTNDPATTAASPRCFAQALGEQTTAATTCSSAVLRERERGHAGRKTEPGALIARSTAPVESRRSHARARAGLLHALVGCPVDSVGSLARFYSFSILTELCT